MAKLERLEDMTLFIKTKCYFSFAFRGVPQKCKPILPRREEGGVELDAPELGKHMPSRPL